MRHRIFACTFVLFQSFMFTSSFAFFELVLYGSLCDAVRLVIRQQNKLTAKERVHYRTIV